MRLGLHTDSLSESPLEPALDLAASLGITALEIPCGGQSSAPHLSLGELLASDPARRRFQYALDRRGMRLSALNCSGWPLHPLMHDAQDRLIRDTIRLAELMSVEKIVTMSGCPGDGGTTPNWVWYPWPSDAVALLQRQWEQAITYWVDVADYALAHGVSRIAMELHPVHLVHNVPSLLRLRETVGTSIGANLDPSHFFWQQVDPLAAARTLGPAVYHVHLKDVAVNPLELALAGVLDDRPMTEAQRRAWSFATVGRGHGPDFWRQFIGTLAAIGYDDAVSIENAAPQITASPCLSQEEALREAADIMRTVLDGAGVDGGER